MKTTQQAIQINSYGNNDVVMINQQADIPHITPRTVLIKMHAAGVNPVDWMIREGYLEKTKSLPFPLTLGMDFAGVIEAISEDVKEFKVGDAVFGTTNYFSGGTGTFAEYILADVSGIWHKPKNINFIEAAAMPMAGISAWQVLVDTMKISKDDKILIHGGAGGIGSFAIQLAKYFGAYVVTTVSNDAIEFVKNLGADQIIDYKNEAFENLLTGFDFVYDTVGGETYRKSFQILKRDGAIVSMLEQPDESLMQQYHVNAAIVFTEVNQQRLAGLAKLIEKQMIKISINRVFSLEQTNAALQYLQDGHPMGKVIIIPN